MADETLSFAIVFEEANKVVNGVREVGQALEGLKSGAETAASGLDDAARAAIAGADALQGIGKAADEAKAALSDVSGAVDLEVDPAPLVETAAAAEQAGVGLQAFASEVAAAKSEADLAADAMEALGFATAEEEQQAQLARDALAALAGETGKLGGSSEGATAGVSKLSAAFGNLGTVAKAAVGSFVGFAALRAVAEVGDLIGRSFRTAAGEFIEAEKAATALDAALQSTGKFSSQATTAVREFAEEIARTTTFTDDAVISAAALIAQVGQLGGPKLVEATQAAVELSAVLGRDLQQSALLLARGAAGATEAFSRFGIVVKGAGTDAEKFDAILGQISAKFGGRAAADARTFGGSIQQLQNSWKEFLETVGQSLVVFQPVLNTLTRALQKANKLLGEDTVSSSLDARAALKGVGADFQEVADTLSHSNLRKLLAQAAEGSKVGDVIATAVADGVKRAEETAAKAEIAIKATVEGGSLDEIADVEHDIAALRRAAEETGNAELRAIVRNLEFTLAAAKQTKDLKIKFEGVGRTIQELEQVADLVGRLRELGGAEPFEIIDAKVAAKNAADFATAAELIRTSTNAIIESVDKVAAAGGKVSGTELSEGFEALDQARAQILEKFGKLAPEIDAAIKDAQDRLQDKARELNVRIELNLVGGFGQEAIDALVASFDQAEAEINAFRDFVRAVNAAAGADDLTLIQTEKLLAQARSLQDIVPIVQAAMERLRQAVALKAVTGGPAASEGIAALFSAAQQGAGELEKAFGAMSEEAQAAFRDIFEGLQGLAAAFPAILGPVQQFGAEASTTASSVAESFGQALTGLALDADKSSQRIRQIFATMVRDILRELALIKGFRFLGPIGSFLGAVIGAIPKLELPPVEFPQPLVPTPVIPPPAVPKVDPIQVGVEVLPASVPVPELPNVPALELQVVLGAIPELPSLEADPIKTVLESPELPTVPGIPGVTIPVEFGAVEKPALPEIGEVEVPLAFANLGAPALPDFEALTIPLAFTGPQIPSLPEFEALTIAIAGEFELPELPEVELPQVTIPVAFETPELPVLPELEAPEVALSFARPQLPELEEVPASLEFARRLPESMPASLEFSRLVEERAAASAVRDRRRDTLRVLEGQRAQPAANITINATDGISVRRQLTAGALRREIERNFRRGS